MAAGFLVLLFVSQAAARPVARALHHLRTDVVGLEVLRMAFSIKMVETALAVLSVALVTVTYSLLIRRGSLMSTTAMYPRRSIERNIGNLLTLAWPRRSNEDLGTGVNMRKDFQASSRSSTKLSSAISNLPSIRLFYLGRMDTDNHSSMVARGLRDCAAKPDLRDGKPYRPRLWITGGSPLTKNVVQLLVWEWVSLWLILIMLFATLLYNGFLTDELSTDSYPRLAVVIIYALAYLFHFWYVWTVCASFFTNVAAGAAWSLLERAKFAICDSKKFRYHRKGSPFEFRGIDKASAEYVPITFHAFFKHEVNLAESLIDDNCSSFSPSPPVMTLDDADAQQEEDHDDPREVRAALATLDAAQKAQRATATDSAVIAVDRVIANAMVMMAVTLSSGFSSWIANQLTDNSPNNFSTTQIGSLALLASLSLGAATMFTSAMHLSILDSSYATIVSLKETKINGQAVDHYKKRQSSDTLLSFSKGTVPVSRVNFFEIVSTNRLRNILGVLFLGPAFTLMPNRAHHERTSEETEFDLKVRVGPEIDGGSTSTVVFTTRGTDRHARERAGRNFEAINVCYIEDEKDVVWERKEPINSAGQ